MAVTVNRVKRKGSMYVNAVKMASGSYGENATFYGPTKDTYKIGNDGHPDEHQFLGEVMDLYVLDQVLSQQELEHLRGLCLKAECSNH